MAEANQGPRSLRFPQWVGYLSDEKLPEKMWASSALQQEQERALNEESIDGLIATHSKKDEEDPVGIRDFALGKKVVETVWLKELASTAVKEKNIASRHVEDAKKEINRRVGLVNEKDSHELAETLRGKTKDRAREVEDCSKKLNLFMGETPQDQALRDSHGDEVESMNKQEKSKAFEKEGVKRISDREEAVDKFIRFEQEDVSHRAKVDSVYSLLDRQGKLKTMKDRAEGNINLIQEKMVEEDQVLQNDSQKVEQLRDAKDEHLSELAAKRENVTKLLERLLKESAELSDAEAKHGAMALKLQQLEQDLKIKTSRSADLQTHAQDALCKLGSWKSEVETGTATLEQEVEKAMRQVVAKDIKTLKEAAIGKQVALQLCQKSIDQKESEIREKVSELGRENRILSKLLSKFPKRGSLKQERLWKAEHEQSKLDAQAKIGSLTEKIHACTNKLEGLKRKQEILSCQYKNLLDFEQYGTKFGSNDIELQAVAIANQAHTDFDIFGECAESSDDEAANMSAEVLALRAQVHQLSQHMEVARLQREFDAATSEAGQFPQLLDVDHGNAGSDAHHGAADLDGTGRAEALNSGSREASAQEHGDKETEAHDSAKLPNTEDGDALDAGQKSMRQEGEVEGAQEASDSTAGEASNAQGASTGQKTTQVASADLAAEDDTACSSSGSVAPAADSSGLDFQLV